MTWIRCHRRPLLFACGVLCAAGAGALRAQETPATAPATQPLAENSTGDLLNSGPAAPLPPELQGVGIDEHLNGPLPLDLTFRDERGRTVKLGDYFDGRRPVILTLNYYRCPMLCGLQLNGLLDSLKELEWTAGENFRIVTVSFDPLETPLLAKAKQQGYLAEYGRPAAADGWAFLTGANANIQQLLGATGFNIRWNERRKEWMHTAALILCTPDGRISRYLYGVMYDPKTLRLSLVEASEGKVGSTLDRVLLYCFHYDAVEGKYAVMAFRLVQVGAGLVAVAVAGLVIGLWRWEVHRRKVTVKQA